MGDETCYGYKNRETWHTRIWMGADDKLSAATQRMTADALDGVDIADADAVQGAKARLESDLSDAYEDYYLWALKPEFASSLWSDLLGYAHRRIDWKGLAADLIDKAVAARR